MRGFEPHRYHFSFLQKYCNIFLSKLIGIHKLCLSKILMEESINQIPGTLLSVQMINFMKHDNLLIELSPRVNFITGRNGSGKSSILVALSVGLGSNTRISGRGNNLFDLIKDGKHEATIIIKIKNGKNGYNYEKYGEVITITRKITRSSTRFEISGMVRTNSSLVREELTKILTFFNIQIDNPCSIMHQDVAKEFIGSSTPQTKYELFMKGTLITKLNDEIKTIENNIEKIKMQRAGHIEGSKKLEQDFQEQKRLNDIVEEAGDLLNVIHELENELVWSHYRQSMINSEESEKKLSEVEQYYKKHEEKLNEFQNKCNEARNEFNAHKKKVQEEIDQLAEFKKQKDKLADNLKTIRSNISSNKAQLKRSENFIESAQSDLSEQNKKLEQFERQKENAIETAQLKRKQFIAQKEEEQLRYERELQGVEDNLNAIKDNAHNLINERDSLKGSYKEINERITYLKNKLDSLKSVLNTSSQNSILNRISTSSRRFSFPPIGPISKYIRLKDKKWGVAVQQIIGKCLDMFIVNTDEDERYLRSVLGKDIPRITIAVSNFTRNKYQCKRRNNALPDDAISIIDAITFIDSKITGNNGYTVDVSTVIFNVLLDVYAADRYFCIEDEEVAKRIAFENKDLSTITPEGYQFKNQNGYKFIFAPKTRGFRIGVDESERISKYENEMQQLSSSKDNINSKLNDIERNLNGIKRDRNNIETKRNSLLRLLNRIKVELQSIPDELFDFDTNLNNIKSRIEKLQNIIHENSNAIPAIKEKITQLQSEKRNLIEEISGLTEKLNQTDTFKSESDNLYNNLRLAERELEKEKRVIATAQEKWKAIKEETDKLSQEAQSNLEKARAHSPECEEKYLNSARPPQTLISLLAEEKKKYEAAKSLHGLDFTQVRAKFLKTKAMYENALRYLKEQEEFLELSSIRLDNRKKKLMVILRSITRRAKISFLAYQNQRKYVGKLSFNHEKRIIEISVKQTADQNFTDVSNLSGGEKSYCLVSLLLSLWEVMECPFYCVDEFDVCMDDVNRQAATTLLVNSAKIMENRQFIFITPLSLDHIKQNEYISIFEVRDT